MKKTFRKILLLHLLCIISTTIYAQSQNSLVVEMRNGERVAFAFTDNPQIRFVDGNLVVNTNLYEFTYAENSVQRYLFDLSYSGISSPDIEGNYYDGDNIVLRLGKSNESVYVYTIDGKVALTAQSDAEGTAHISLSKLPSGVYVVRSGNFSTKILKR